MGADGWGPKALLRMRLELRHLFAVGWALPWNPGLGETDFLLGNRILYWTLPTSIEDQIYSRQSFLGQSVEIPEASLLGRVPPRHWVPSFTYPERSLCPGGRAGGKGSFQCQERLDLGSEPHPMGLSVGVLGFLWEGDCLNLSHLSCFPSFWAPTPLEGWPLPLGQGRSSLSEKLFQNWFACLPLTHSFEAPGKLFLGSKKAGRWSPPSWSLGIASPNFLIKKFRRLN